MKRKILFIATIVICLALVATGTLAYYTAKVTAHNVITTGGVSIDLKEYADKDLSVPYQENQTGILPGTTVYKYANITNDGEADAWLRVKFVPTIQLDEKNPDAHKDGDLKKELIQPDLSLLRLTMPKDLWLDGKDGYFYYKNVLKAGSGSGAFGTGDQVLALESVTFDKTMGNAYQGCTATVTVVVQAVQVAHNPENPKDYEHPVLAAKGWPKDK